MNKNEEILNKIRCIVGEAAYMDICRECGSCIVRFPAFRGNFITIEERNNAIRLDFYKGLTTPELAEKYNLQIPTIYKIIESRD